MTRLLSRLALAVITLFATWFGGRAAGKSAVKIDNLQDEVKAHEIRDEIDRDASTGDAHKRLRQSWRR